jgi:hypothetical protein
LFIFLEAFGDPFVTAIEAASQSSQGTRANLHKVEAAEEGLLLGELAEYTASRRIDQLCTQDASFDSPRWRPATRAKLRFSPKIIFLEINKVNNFST